MRRLHRILITGLLLALTCSGSGAVMAASNSAESGLIKLEPDNSELFESSQSQIERSTGIDQQQPVDWTCGNPSGSDPNDGPAVSSVLCDGSFIQFVDVPEGSEIQLEKSSNTVMVTAPGPVFYGYAVINSGSTPLTGIELLDDHVDAPPSCPQSDLAIGESMFCTSVYTVTVTDINNGGSPVAGSGVLENNAIVNVAGSGISATDNLQIPIVVAPAGISVAKSSPTTVVSAPGPVSYDYLITNTGGVPVTGVELSDNHVDSEPLCPLLNLNPGESMTCNAVYTVTMADIVNMGSPTPGSGFLENEATVNAGPGVSDDDFLQIPIVTGTGGIAMDKDSPTAVVTQPGPVDYTYLVTNTGSIPLSGFELNDNHVDSFPTCPLFILNPGQSMVCTATYTVTQADMDNLGSPTPGSGFLINAASIVAVEGATSSDTHQIPIIPDETDPTNPLVIVPQGSSIGVVPVNEPYEFEFSTIGGLPPIMFSGSNAPPGLSFSQVDDTFILSGTPLEVGQFVVTVTAIDSAEDPNLASRIYSLRVEGESEPVGPTLPEAAFPDAIEGQPYEFMLEILGGSPPFEFTAEGLPQGLGFSLDGNLLTLSGSALENGDFVLDVTVTDSSDPAQSDSQSYDLRVVPLLRLIPEDSDLGLAQINEPFEFAFSTQGGLPPIVMEGVDAPPGLEFEMAGDQLILSGAPGTAGDFEFTVSAGDSMMPPQFVERDYLLSVVLALNIQPESLSDAIVGEDYLAVLSVLNGIPPYSFEISGLPAGLSQIDNTINGNPNQAGSFTLTASAIDAVGNTGARNLVLEVRAAGDVMVGESLPDAFLNTAYGYQLRATGAAAPITWSGGGGLPNGFVLESTGLVNGIAQQVGEFSFSATANVVDGSAFPGSFTVSVLDPDLISANPGFPTGQTGVSYRSPTAIRGGTPPFSCQVISGSLPPGLSLNGCNEGIDGIPTEPGSFPFSLGVMDSGSPDLVAEIDGIIQVAEDTPLPDPLPPDLDFLPPVNIPVSDLSAQSPDAGFPDETLQGLTVDDWGNRYVVGFSYNGDDYDIRALKFSADGELLWDQVFDSGDHDYGYGIAVSASEQAVYASGYSLAGNNYQAVLIRYDLAGVEQWVVNNPSNSQVTTYYGLAADDSGVFAIGERYNGTNFDALATRHSNDGSLLWESIRSAQNSRTGYAVIQSSCGNSTCLLIGGSDGESNRSGWVEELQSGTGAGTPLTTVASAPVYALQSTDGGFVTAGSSDSDDWFINAFDINGQSQWSISLTSGDNLRGLAQDRSGFLYAAGSGNSAADGMVVLISPEGEIQDTTLYDNGAAEVFRGVVVGPDGMVTTAGQRSDVGGNRFLIVDFDTGKAY